MIGDWRRQPIANAAQAINDVNEMHSLSLRRMRGCKIPSTHNYPQKVTGE
jgi:hypothetical protein